MMLNKLNSNLNRIIKYSLFNILNRASSTVPAEKIKYEAEYMDQQIITPRKIYEKKPAREPFVKNLFLSRCDTEILPYPEILDNEALADMHKRMQPILDTFATINPSEIDAKRKVSKIERDKIESLGLFNRNNFIDATETELCRLREIISKDSSILAILTAQHNLGLRAIMTFGNDVQKMKYLNDLMSGKQIAAFCLIEPSTINPSLLNTTAKLDESAEFYLLNGEKAWVVNGGTANVYIVFAQCERVNHQGENENCIGTFLVDAASAGITVMETNSLGITASEMCTVRFSDVIIPKDNVLGEIENGMEIAATLLKLNRFHVGSECIGILRNIIEDVTKYVISIGHVDHQLTDLESAKNMIAKATVNAYAIESMTYFTAGLMDMYENQDTDLEQTIVKVFSSEKCQSTLDICTRLYGQSIYNKDHYIHRIIRDMQRHLYFDESNIVLKQYIAAMGLQHAGKELVDVIKKLRNPLFHPGYVIGRMWQNRGQARDQPNLKLKLEHYFHPSLTLVAQFTEYCILRLGYASEILLMAHGTEVINKHLELERLANIVCDVYAMISVVSRASRSYCIGLQNAEFEIMLATTFCNDAVLRVKNNVSNICATSYVKNDDNYLKIGEKVFKWKKYIAEHPTTRNF